MAANPYRNIALHHDKASDALTAAGAKNLKQEVRNGGKLIQHSGTYNGVGFLIQLFVNGNGKCTIGSSKGFDEATFVVMADAIKNGCQFGGAAPLNFSIPRFAHEHGQMVIDFLVERGCDIRTDEQRAGYRLLRIAGPMGDTLTLKWFSNGTLQLQGNHIQVAAWALDIVQTLLPLDEVLAHQKAVYEVPLTIEQIKQDLEARTPHVHDRLAEEVRIQLSSALALTKVGIALEDYSALAFPALRGLEGYCFQLLRDEVGVAVEERATLGEFFENVYADYRLLSLYKGTTSPEVQAALAKCYKLWHQQRHRLFHMDGTLETTRILDTRSDAVAIVDEVLTVIENSHIAIQRSKGEQ